MPSTETKRQRQEQSMGIDEFCKRLLAGCTVSVVTRTLTAPLERVKLDLQLYPHRTSAQAVVREIFAKEGPRGFLKGLGLNIIRSAPFKATNFASFAAYKRLLLPPEASPWDATLKYVAGALAGVTATCLCFPLDTVRTRLMAPGSTYKGFWSTVRHMYRTEGFGSFYLGSVPALISTAPAGAVYYGTYELLKDFKRKDMDLPAGSKVQPVSWAEIVLFGAIASAASELVSFPFEVVRRNLQMGTSAMAQLSVQSSPNTLAALDEVYHGDSLRRTVRSIYYIVRTKGPSGLYAGIGPSLLQVLPSGAVGYTTYELMCQLLKVTDNDRSQGSEGQPQPLKT